MTIQRDDSDKKQDTWGKTNQNSRDTITNGRPTNLPALFEVTNHANVLRLPFGSLFISRFGSNIIMIFFLTILWLLYKYFSIRTIWYLIFWSFITTGYVYSTIGTVPIGSIGYGIYRGKGTWAIQMAPLAFLVYSKCTDRRAFIMEELKICFTHLKYAGAKKIILITWLATPKEVSQVLSSPSPQPQELGAIQRIRYGFFTLPYHWAATFHKWLIQNWNQGWKLPFFFIIGLFKWSKSDKKKDILKPLLRPWYKYEWFL